MKRALIANLFLIVAMVGCVPSDRISKEDINTSEKRYLEQFEGVSISNSIKLTMEKGDTNLAIIETSNIDTEDIIVEVIGSTLNIYIENRDESFWKRSNWTGNVEIILTYTENLKEITARNSSRIEAKSILNSEDFELDVSNSAEVELEVNSDDFEISISNSGRASIKTDTKFLDTSVSNSGKLDISGQAKSQKLAITNSGQLWAFELISDIVNANISGSGSAEIFVSKELRANISNSGDVRYKGNPDKLIVDTSNSGRISKSD